jgi:hypothetical protein
MVFQSRPIMANQMLIDQLNMYIQKDMQIEDSCTTGTQRTK